MGNYVLHYDFQAQDMDNVDIVLGYPWMDSVGIVNLNVQKKFLKLWYKKKKITLQDDSLSQPTNPKAVHDAVPTRTLEVIPINTLDDEPMVTNTIDDTTTKEELTQDVHQTIETTPPESIVAEVKKEVPLVKIASYHHPHHLARQQSFRKEGGNQQSYGP